MATIHLTKLQSEELEHKLTILRDEQDLLDSYEMKAEDAQALIDALPNGEGLFVFDEKYTDAMAGEIENLIDIASGNMEIAHPEQMAQLRGYMSSMRQLIKKLQNS